MAFLIDDRNTLDLDEGTNRIHCLWHNPGVTGVGQGMGYNICLSSYLKGEGGVLMCFMWSDNQYSSNCYKIYVNWYISVARHLGTVD